MSNIASTSTAAVRSEAAAPRLQVTGQKTDKVQEQNIPADLEELDKKLVELEWPNPCLQLVKICKMVLIQR